MILLFADLYQSIHSHSLSFSYLKVSFIHSFRNETIFFYWIGTVARQCFFFSYSLPFLIKNIFFFFFFFFFFLPIFTNLGHFI